MLPMCYPADHNDGVFIPNWALWFVVQLEEYLGRSGDRETIRRQSFDGTFFVDNAVRTADGRLEVTRNRTEVCQYFAFFFGVATPESHAELWRTLRDESGPGRRERNPYPEVGLANSFIGNMLRVELLSREGLSQQVLDESIDYLLYMAERTGTLWENVGDSASCNHGFASHIVHTLFRDVLGARKVDRAGRRLVLRFAPLELEVCRGRIPTPDGPITIWWSRKGGRFTFSVSAPESYEVTVE